MPDRPVIGFLTDFGLDGAAAICRGVMLSIARDAQIVDISHVVRKFAISDGAYLLRTALPWLPVGTHVAVVDPGVGTSRRPIGVLTARGDVLIGPDNGLLPPAADRLGGIVAARMLENRAWMLPHTSSTFHGRDIFAPVGAHLAMGAPFPEVGPAVDPADLVALDLPRAIVKPGRLGTGVEYVDSFGNLRLAGGPAELGEAVGAVAPGTPLLLELAAGGATATFARTFGEVPAGELLVYTDSAGDLAIGQSSGSASQRLGLEVGARIGLRRA
jgi:S-adenosylmethionine hydrolase